MRAQVAGLILDLFKVRPNEARRAGLAFVYLFAAIGAFIVGRIARTVLFLELPEFKQLLPFAYVGTAITVSLTMTLYSKVERVLRRDHTNAVTLVILTLVTISFRFFLVRWHTVAAWAFYFWVEMFGTFVVVQFWSLCGELFHAREAKRLFAFIGGGGVLANVAIGFAINGAVQHLGTENLLFLICGCFLVSLVMVVLIGRDAARELEATRGRKKANARDSKLPALATKHVKLLALVVVVTYLVSTVVDYQFQAILGDSIPSKDERSAYLGGFFAVTGIISGIIQFVFTSRILEHFGLLVALTLLPSAMLTGSLGLGLAPLLPALMMVVFTKGSENCLRYTVNDSTLQLLYLPLPASVRGRAKTFIDGVLKPVSIGVAGLLLAVLVGSLKAVFPSMPTLPSLAPSTLAWGVAVLLVVWIGLLVRLRSAYVESLVQTLEQRRLDFTTASFEVKDESTLQTLALALKATRLADVLHAIELLMSVPAKARESLDREMAELLRNPRAEVRVAVLRLLARDADAGVAISHSEAVLARLSDADPTVRAAAVLTLTAARRENASDDAAPLLGDPDSSVRASTIAGLIRYGGLDGVVRAAGDLKAMVASSDARERERAAWILGEVGVATFYQPLIPLLTDADSRVRRTAIEAAGKLVAPQLLSSIVSALAIPRLASTAVAAISRYGVTGLEVGTRVLADPTAPREARMRATRLLTHFPETRSVLALCDGLSTHDPALRTAVVRALVKLETQDASLVVDRAVIRRVLRDEAKRYIELLAVVRDLALDKASPLLADALEHRVRSTRDRMIGLVALIGRDPSVEAALRNIGHAKAAVRANAIEVLDNVLEKDDKQLVIPIVEDTSVDLKLDQLGAQFGVTRLTREDRLAGLLTSGDTWLVTCAALATADLNVTTLSHLLDAASLSSDVMCKEAVTLANHRLNTANRATVAAS